MATSPHRSLLVAVAPVLAIVVIGCGNDDPAATTTTSGTQQTTARTSAEEPATATSRAPTGDDGLTYAQARRAERSAKRDVDGVVIEIDRDNEDDGSVSYDVDVLSRAGTRTQVSFDGRFRVTRRRTKERPDDLTYGQAVRARKAALRRTSGVVTDIDGEDEGSVRFEVDVLTRRAGPKTVRLSRSYSVLSSRANHDDQDDD